MTPRRRSAAIFVLAFVVAVGGFALARRPRADDPFLSQRGDATKGAVVFTAAGCASCHATGAGGDAVVDPTRLGGGLAIKTAFGRFVAPNISSDRADGIGAWTDAEVANAFLSGIRRDGAQLFPVLPYPSYARMTRADARDLIAYLRSLPAVPGRAPLSDVRFPFSWRPGVAVWKALFFHPRPVTPDPARSSAWNRGRYVATALAHCAECHSPRNALGAVVSSLRYAGGPDSAGEGWVPNITPAPDGTKGWSGDDWSELLTAGVTPDNDEVSAPMSDVVRNFAQLPKADVDAVVTFMRALPLREGPPRPKTKS